MTNELPTKLGWVVLAIYASIFVIATITFALRVYVRVRILKQFSIAEDWAAGVGWLLFLCYSAVSMIGTFYGAGQHMNLVPSQDLPIFFKILWLMGLMYWPACMAVKLSITLMLLRFAVEKSHRILIYAVGIIVQTYSVVFILLYVFQCLPVSFFWTQAGGDTHGRCIDQNAVFNPVSQTYAGITFVYDATMALLPWFIVRKMRLDLRTRIMIAGVLALGSITYIATIVRIPFLVLEFRTTADITYAIVGSSVASCVELGLSIIASSAILLKPLFRKNSSRGVTARPATPKLAAIPESSAGTYPSRRTMYDEIDISAERWRNGC